MTKIEQRNTPEATLHQSILDDIFSGKLKAGQRLKVSELAERFDVSTSPVREVLRQMQGEGIVVISPNKGAIIKPFDPQALQNVFEMLEMITPYFVEWFAKYARPEAVEEVAQIQEQIRALDPNEINKLKRLDSEFHWLVCKHHYNSVAAQTWKNLRIVLGVHGASLPISQARRKIIIAEHDELVAAFRANDAAAASEISRRHVAGSQVEMAQQTRALGLYA